MKLFSSIVMALALTASVASADTPPKKDAPAATASDADVQKFLKFFDKLVDTVVADKDSCPKMATDVNALIDANKDLLAAAKKASDEGKKLPDSAQKHMADSVGRMVPAMKNCGNDKAVQAAFERMDMKKPAK